ncbi:conserved hypothetical protein [Histoplasma capsulatum G186AR]|uniref:Uncharacterized protein n=2 Tax=Ajellomyces capsulatus TaxID=5037 RepID=C0NX20_AJECG|nr:uncharacterized protein HCBG_08012 [Histoplasma capsulatum G186AR]EEH03886.1 conserved hypothetical protein [Histoplasma capsulatum G186AR]KAG5295494.1 hypothetical protein I7I52_05776 [Histoplasma capsulatum]QSS73475.1 hypothetical protein I7I50_08260 [Histoplasma capsulatum G186AR]
MLGQSTKSSTHIPAQQAAKEKAFEIKRLQEEALRSLALGSLYIVLYLRSDPPRPNDFHWGYYFHTIPSGGTKYHVKNLGSGWITEHGSTTGLFKSNFLCVVVQIAAVAEAKYAQVDQIMRTHDGKLNSIPGISCRVWILSILQMLIENGIVQCSSCAELEQECFEIGNQHRFGAIANNQPRPVVRSTLCTI